jgi:arylsulfatase A-like enzyme
VECFDPHEPWFVPEHYRRMYGAQAGQQQQVASRYRRGGIGEEFLSSTQINYSALCTMCDRWFQHFYETMRNMGLLERTLLIVTSDHGHSIGDRGYLGKTGYPSDPSVFDVPLMVRHPEGRGAGKRTDYLVQHHDLTAQILSFAGVEPPEPIDGRPFFDAAVKGEEPGRDHATVGWGSAVTVIKDRWHFNCKVDGTGPFLYDLETDPRCETNVADDRPGVVRELFEMAVRDAGGEFPEYLTELARTEQDAPGCSSLAARPE